MVAALVFHDGDSYKEKWMDDIMVNDMALNPYAAVGLFGQCKMMQKKT